MDEEQAQDEDTQDMEDDNTGHDKEEETTNEQIAAVGGIGLLVVEMFLFCSGKHW